MSENKTKNYYFAAGVFKIDYRAAGYAELRKIAQEWAKDPNFYLLLVRGVSDKNFGIEFIYKCEVAEEDKDTYKGVKPYREELIQKYGKNEEKPGFYAWDYESGYWSTDNDEPFSPESVILFKPFN